MPIMVIIELVTTPTSFHPYDVHDTIIMADNFVRPKEKEDANTLHGKDDSYPTIKSVYPLPRMRRNLFSMANAVDTKHNALVGPIDVKFLRNIIQA